MIVVAPGVGRHVCIATKQGLVITGRVVFTSPTKVILVHPEGRHEVDVAAIQAYTHHDLADLPCFRCGHRAR